MKDEVASKAVSYMLNLPDWRPKLRLAKLLNAVDFGIFSSFRRSLTQLQDASGLFPLFWKEGEPASLRYTAIAIDLLSGSKDHDALDSANVGLQMLSSLQGIDGSWNETAEAAKVLKRPQIHPGWSKNLDRAEVTSLILRNWALDPFKESNYGVHEKGLEWLQRFLKEQDYETNRPGDEYSLNPWTLDMVVSAILEAGVDPTKHSISEAISVLSRNLTRELRRKQPYSHGIWGLLAGTKSLRQLGDQKKLLLQIAEELSNRQQRDGSWRLGRVMNGTDSGEWTLQALSFLTLVKALPRAETTRNLKEGVSFRNFVATTLQKNEDTTRRIFLTRFEEVGVKPNQAPEHLLFASFVYSILEQFYWVTSEFDPQAEYLKLILQVGRLERVGLTAYTDAHAVRRALFRIQSLREQASARKSEVAQSISLFATFLEKESHDNFQSFGLALRKFILAKASTLALGWKRDVLLGELLRLEVLEKTDPQSLVRSIEGSMKCFPGVGDKVYSLFLYYIGHVFKIWDDLPLSLLDVPTDWNLVKPFAMLRLTTTPLDQLKERPQLATASIQETAKEMFQDDPGKLYGLWVVGHEWCARPWMCRDRAGRYCWLYAQCPYPQSRR